MEVNIGHPQNRICQQKRVNCLSRGSRNWDPPGSHRGMMLGGGVERRLDGSVDLDYDRIERRKIL